MKIRDGFAYVTKTKEDFDDFMKAAESEGLWLVGGRHPMESRLCFKPGYFPTLVVVGTSIVCCHMSEDIFGEYTKKSKRTRVWRREEKGRETRDRFLTTMVVVLLMTVIGLCALAARGVVKHPWTLIAILPTCALAALAMYFLLCRREELF